MRPSGLPLDALRAANRRYLETYRANSKLMVIWENAAATVPDMATLLHEAKAAFVTRAEKSIRGLQEAGLADPPRPAPCGARAHRHGEPVCLHLVRPGRGGGERA